MRHAGQCALVCVTLAFIGLDVFPAWEIFAFSEDVRMPPGHFAAYAQNDVLKREMSRLLCHTAVEDDLKKQVAKLVGKSRHVVALNGVGPFIGFLDRDRKSVVSGKSVSVRVNFGGRRLI